MTVEDTIGIKRSGVAAITTLQQTGSGLTLNGPSGYHPLMINSNGTELVRFKNDGNVGIGTTNPQNKLHVVGTKIRLDSNSGGYYQYTAGGGFRFALYDDSSKTYLFADGDGSNPHMTFNAGFVGIGTENPSYQLDVNGGIRAGGKVTYHKSAGSLTTTGYAVAGLVAGSNGMSAGFTFTCFGHLGDYQKIVYGCYNASGTWNTQKVIDEGTNDFDVTASANGSTITFTFKSRSGTKSYTPRVSVEAFGQSINDTYA